MFNLELHQHLTLEHLQNLRHQAALERQLPQASLRRTMAKLLRGLAFRLERVELQQAQI